MSSFPQTDHAASPLLPSVERRHILSVTLEDYYHTGSLHSLIHQERWDHLESRFEENTLRVLDLLDRCGAKATFIVLGWVAEKRPEIVREVVRRGHEIASGGYGNRSIHEMTPGEFRVELRRARQAIEGATGVEVVGHRVGKGWIGPKEHWVLDILAEEGYVYDCSLMPILRRYNSDPRRFFLHQHHYKDKTLWEFPASTMNIAGFRFPISGGNYFRQFPHRLLRRLVDQWDRTQAAPFVMYFHIWELDRSPLRVSALSRLSQLRTYRNLGARQQVIVEYYLRKYRFVGMADYLGIGCRRDAPERAQEPRPLVVRSAPRVSNGKAAVPVTIVVPCFNEETSLRYLVNTLDSVAHMLAPEYALEVILVDDASTDRTWAHMQKLCGSRPNYRLVRHERNRGPAAAILTGIQHASTEAVCSIDCDCSYDPHELKAMLPLLTDGVDIVTASPYHRDGAVLNVPAWRLALSKSLSVLYRLILHQKLATYTSCFRVYRRSALAGVEPSNGGFLGVAETLALLDLKGARIVEHPATLEVRIFGQSKMKVLKTIAGHLGLLGRLTMLRLFPRPANRDPGDPGAGRS